MATTIISFLPYHEPGIATILIQSSLILILNIVNTIFDKLIFCGLLGQVFIGVAWGTPGAKWLGQDTEDVIVQLGYLGLILLVYEGGLDTSFRSLKANLFLSVAVAITGISFPMALSFVLQPLVNATALQAFAAGAALCSTSLGTTFTILSTSGLSATRLGTVLSSAAMMDDVVGLVMVQVISNLGETADSFNAITVVRPLAVSVGLAIAVPLVCRLVAQPLTVLLNAARKSNPNGAVDKLCGMTYTAFIIHTLLLIGLVTGATYAGTSNLFAAYLAGASISWWDSEVPHPDADIKSCSLEPSSSPIEQVGSSPEGEATEGEAVRNEHSKSTATSGTAASIGFAIPITDMFRGEIVWRGIVYTILMLFAKIITGLWLLRLNLLLPKVYAPRSVHSIITAPASCFSWVCGKPKNEAKETARTTDTHELQTQGGKGVRANAGESTPQPPAGESPASSNSQPSPTSVTAPSSPPIINKPLSLYPAAMLGTAMTARGEIGFLIASLAETTGLFKSSSMPSTGSSEVYLVVTWAIVLCTIIGPLGVGTLVKRVRRLQSEREKNPGVGGPLGIWGVS
ncbi:Uncharacterized protein BP5553_06756 [Venustampulla echinocandica]|uniref:Cation/H+ exchanger transmembrane domain-containing protein n=1 Tax=Venustampulla echinocandica TaxID=2656787 RepID=A0A370TKU7_9HELO|nr:Uncharacterized protein BP5553_06756 [Venustampulla echinocandica]RDL36144.1 Uncharacterized protein BP5553_06756 [Venustampulla echinocandica]